MGRAEIERDNRRVGLWLLAAAILLYAVAIGGVVLLN